jgi:hypothetical protein
MSFLETILNMDGLPEGFIVAQHVQPAILGKGSDVMPPL